MHLYHFLTSSWDDQSSNYMGGQPNLRRHWFTVGFFDANTKKQIYRQVEYSTHK